MKNISIVNLLLIGQAFISGCTPTQVTNFWTGVYQSRASIYRYDKAEKAYYAKETSTQKVLRKKNKKICEEIVTGTYPYVSNNYEKNFKISSKRTDLEEDCMKERGSPIFKYLK